jgi:hypothetical protein
MTRTGQRQAMRASGLWRGSKAGRTRRVVNFREWSGLEHWHAPKAPPPYSPRLADRVGLVLVSAAALGAEAERFGLGAYLVVIGRSVLDAGLIVPDDLDGETLAAITEWAGAHPVETTSGAKPWETVTLSDFYDHRHGVFNQRAYVGAGWCIGADLGRVFGLAAEHVGARLGQNARTWEAWLPGWGKEHEHGRWKRSSPHRPPLRVEARRVGWQITFGPCEKGHGKRIDGRIWPGAFIDVLSLAYSLDGDRGASFSEHRENFGLAPSELPIAVSVDEVGAAEVTRAVLAIHELVVALDEHAAQWFTTREDRNEGCGRLDLTRTVSPGGIAAQIPLRFGLRAPLETFRLTDDEHRAGAETFHGGRCDADPSLLGVPFSSVTVDVSSCFPLVAHLTGWWELVCAEKIVRRNVTAALRKFCQRVADDPFLALDPSVIRRFGCCLVKVVPDGEVFPIEVEDPLRPAGRLEVVPVFSPDRPLWFSALDVIAAAVGTGRPPEIVEATAYIPHGRQAGLKKRLAILPGLVAGIEDDPALLLVEHRRHAKDRRDLVLAAELRVAVNSLAFGNLARFDELLRKEGRGWVTGEKPGPFNSLPIASSVTAGSHLLLAAFDRMVRDKGGVVAYRDTDSSIIPASPDGGDLVLPDGSVVHELSHAEVDEVLRAFDGLLPAPEWPVWKSERGTTERPLRAFVFGPKRHAEMLGDEIIDLTEAGLGGTYADPPAMRGRDAKGYRDWSSAAVRREIDYTLARRANPQDALRPEAPWDAGMALPFPAFRRLVVKSPEMAKLLPTSLGARPGTRYVEVSGAIWSGPSFGRTVVALDPGGDLANWRDLCWIDTLTGAPVRVTTNPMELGSLILESLSERAIEWSRAPRSEPIDAVVVDPNLIALKGRVSGVIDADADGLTDLRHRRPSHEDADGLAFVLDEVARLGPTSFAGRFDIPRDRAKKLSAGRRPSPATIRQALAALPTTGTSRVCALDGCDAPVTRSNALYCGEGHQRADAKRRARMRANAHLPEKHLRRRTRRRASA